MDRVATLLYDELPFKASPILKYHMLSDSTFTLRRAKRLALMRFRAQADRQALTVMPRPNGMTLFIHRITGQRFYRCTFPPYRVYTFFKQHRHQRGLTIKIEQRISVWFTESGHLAYVERFPSP